MDIMYRCVVIVVFVHYLFEGLCYNFFFKGPTYVSDWVKNCKQLTSYLFIDHLK